MGTHYFELRVLPKEPAARIGADITRHLNARKHLGRVLVISENPLALMCVARKNWLRLARSAQKQRAATLNSDRILRLTYAIAHMQRLTFVAKTPPEQPNAHVFFISPDQIEVAPLECYTVYITTPVATERLEVLQKELPDSCLFVDYTNTLQFHDLSMRPKSELEARVTAEWKNVCEFLTARNIELGRLVQQGLHQIDAIDDALDTLLGESRRFIHIASNFQHARDLAQPFEASSKQQRQYEMVSMLAHRVQALSPGDFSLPLDGAFHEEGTFFLRDIGFELGSMREAAPEAILRHQLAERHNLVRALRGSMERQSLRDSYTKARTQPFFDETL